MDEVIRTQFHELSEKIADSIHSISSLVEAELPTTDELGAAHATVDQIVASYNQLVAQIPEAERAPLERTHGRRITDLRRLAARLPKKSAGQTARLASDVPPSGGWPFLLQREPPKSIEPPRVAPVKRDQPALRVGGEVEAWCSTCGGLTDHHIVAIVDGQPKQVICQGCNARHGYRTTPARKSGDAPLQVPTAHKPTREEVEARKKEEARFALMKELAEATEVRNLAPKERYKAGEIIQHPEHGRGKIETVLRGSLLVRFRDGLKSVSTL